MQQNNLFKTQYVLVYLIIVIIVGIGVYVIEFILDQMLQVSAVEF
jgi:SNF family Na+-dependent transporter